MRISLVCLQRSLYVPDAERIIDLPKSQVPTIQPTIASPLQYAYRTKITPHFEAPPRKFQKIAAEERSEGKPHWLKIGFNMVGKRQVMDIEVHFLLSGRTL